MPAAKLMAEKGMFLVANLVTYYAMKDRAAKFGMIGESLAKNEIVLQGGLKSLEICKRHGIPVAYGSDLLGELHWDQSKEFTIRQEVVSPIEIIRSATTIGAEVLRMPGKVGTLQPGAFADAILVDGNPLKDLALLGDQGKHLSLIMKAGELAQEPAELTAGTRRDDRREAILTVVPGWTSSRVVGRMALRTAAGVSLAYILLPMFFVIWLAFFAQEIPSFPPEGYSLKWFRAIPGNDRFVNGFLLSLQVAVVATSIGLAIGVPAAVCLVRGRFGGREAVNNLLLLPLIVPGIVLGIALYVFHVETEIATGWPILGSLGGLIAGHVLIAIPWTVRLITASLVGMDRAVEEAAQSLGADRLTTFRRITLPAILPGIVAAALFGFIASFGNLEMSLFLVGPGRTTLPIAILQYLEWKIDPTIAAVSVLQILFIGGAMLLTDRFVKIGRVV